MADYVKQVIKMNILVSSRDVHHESALVGTLTNHLSRERV